MTASMVCPTAGEVCVISRPSDDVRYVCGDSRAGYKMLVLLVLGSILALLLAILVLHHINRPQNYPPGPRSLPLFGNLLTIRQLVRKLGSQHAAFKFLGEQYESPVISLRLGRDNAVVVIGHAAVTQVLTSDAFLGRPDNFFIRLRTMGSRDGITMTDGALWEEHRRFIARHFRNLGYGKMHMEELIVEELKDLVTELSQAANQGEAVFLEPKLPPSVLNVLWALTAGSRFPHGDARLHRLLELMAARGRAFDMTGGALGTMPWLRHLAPEKTGYNLIKRLNSELRIMLEDTIAAHNESYNPNRTRDLIDAYLHEIKAHENEQDTSFTDNQLVMVCLDMFLAGALTTSNTLNFALMLMVLHPEVQARCFKDIYNNLEKGRSPALNDRPKLQYVEAVLMETMRLYYVVPVIGPRRALKDTKVMDYNIPKDTMVLISVNSVHHDKSHWGDPEVFRPERFLNEKGKAQQDDYLINFGLGKRRCLGDVLAKNCLFLFFTGILQRFRLSVPPGEDPPSRDCTSGITQSPRPYRVLLTPRTACPGSPRSPSRSVSPHTANGK